MCRKGKKIDERKKKNEKTISDKIKKITINNKLRKTQKAKRRDKKNKNKIIVIVKYAIGDKM